MVYGWQTKSWRNSTEHSQQKQECKTVTEQYMNAPRQQAEMILLCHCRSFRFGHDISAHKKLRSDMDWRTWQELANRYMSGERIF